MNKLDLEKYLEAYTFSFKLHKKQIRKGSNIPYFTHLSSVSNLIIENNGTTTQAIAGLLHDAVEDQGGIKTLAIIKKKFGPKVAKIVGQCSDTSIDPKPPWKARKKNILKILKTKRRILCLLLYVINTTMLIVYFPIIKKLAIKFGIDLMPQNKKPFGTMKVFIKNSKNILKIIQN